MMTIGQLAKSACVNVETIRFYERKGLIQQPNKPPSGYRQYGESSLQQVLFVRRAQALGFSLDEIKELMNLATSCEGVQDLAEHKLRLVRKKIASLQSLEANLTALISSCQNNNQASCPVIESLVTPTKPS